MEIWLIPLKDKRGEEIFTHMYNPFGRFMAGFRVRRRLNKLGYKIKESSDKKEQLIFDRGNNLIGKLKTVCYNKNNIEPTVFLKRRHNLYRLENAILDAGCSIEYL